MFWPVPVKDHIEFSIKECGDILNVAESDTVMILLWGVLFEILHIGREEFQNVPVNVICFTDINPPPVASVLEVISNPFLREGQRGKKVPLLSSPDVYNILQKTTLESQYYSPGMKKKSKQQSVTKPKEKTYRYSFVQKCQSAEDTGSS